MPMTRKVPWRPPRGPDVEALEAGIWWDSMRVPADLGTAVLGALRDDTGAVIYDPYGQHLYWLTTAGATDRWERLPGIHPLGTATYVGVPPPHRTDGHGVRWLVTLGQRYLTDPGRLYAALVKAVQATPHPLAAERCLSCRNTTSHPVQVQDGQGLDYACPYCAPEYEPGPGLRALFEAAEPYRKEAGA